MAQETNQKQLPVNAVIVDGQRQYKIIKVLGEGSFGITYLAWLTDASAPGQKPRQVAVKEFFMQDINGREGSSVTSSIQDGMYVKYMRKFKNEASALNKLDHESIVRVYDCFEANNTVYYAMEFLNGGSVDDELANRGPIPEAKVVKLAAQVASALSYLHSSNMLHLDLKPSNLMLRDSDHVALIDFGLAKQFDDSGNPESSTTIGGGTPGYAPIEQQNSADLANFYGGKSSVLPVTMDIYAFGATLYKMLVGKMPPMPDEILNEDVLSPEALYERHVSAKLIQVITKAMRPRKKDRYQSVAEMYEALEPLLQPGDYVKIWTPDDLKKQDAQNAGFEVQRDAGTVIAGAGKPNKTKVVDARSRGKKEDPEAKSNLGKFIIAACVVALIVGGVVAYMLNRDDSPAEELVAEEVVEVTNPGEKPGEAIEAGETAEPGKTGETGEPGGTGDSGKGGGSIQGGGNGSGGGSTPLPPTGPVSVLGGKAKYDKDARTITFNSSYVLHSGDEEINVPAGATLKKVALHSNGRLRSGVLVANGTEVRLDGLNVAL